MKAVICTKYGSPEVLELRDIEKPVPNEHEILINIRATTVASGDVRVRALEAPPFMRFVMRFVLGFGKPRRSIFGTELSGEVESVGKCVTRFKKGDRIMAFTGMKAGGHAEYTCLPENGLIVIKPDNVSYEEAASVLFGGTSALHFLRKGRVRNGSKVLIYGASGSVGTSAVQLAKYYGANVTGVCSTANVDLVKTIGADTVIDYMNTDLASIVERYDVVFDAVGKLDKAIAKLLLAENGRFVTVAQGFAAELLKDVQLIKELLEQDKIRAVIDRVYPLDRIREAHHYVEQGHKKGNVVITIR